MFSLIKQLVILVTFLFLIVFASIYFRENRAHQNLNNKEVSFLVVDAARGTGNILGSVIDFVILIASKLGLGDLDDFSNLNNHSNFDFDDNLREKIIAEEWAQHHQQLEFNDFFRDSIEKIPQLYLDTKIYSNAWRNFWSLNWLNL